jgi:hypothetical protein
MRQLLEAENADRIVHSIAYQMRAARFPVRRDLAGFAFSESAVDEALGPQAVVPLDISTVAAIPSAGFAQMSSSGWLGCAGSADCQVHRFARHGHAGWHAMKSRAAILSWRDGWAEFSGDRRAKRLSGRRLSG